jgi:hypothetical protein
MFSSDGKRRHLNTQWPKRTGIKPPVFAEYDFPALGGAHVLKTNSCAVWGTAAAKTIIGSKKIDGCSILQKNTESRAQYYKRLKTIYGTLPGDLYTFELTLNSIITRVVARNVWIARFIMQKKEMSNCMQQQFKKKTHVENARYQRIDIMDHHHSSQCDDAAYNDMSDDGMSDDGMSDDGMSDDGMSDDGAQDTCVKDKCLFIWLDPQKTTCTKCLTIPVRIKKERILHHSTPNG